MNGLTGTELQVLDREECLDLLARHHLGRLAVSIHDQPVIFPVNYALDGQSIVFRTDRGTKLYGAHNRPVAFEIDGIDSDGWSVLVVGHAELVETADEIRRLQTLALGPWNPGPKEHWVRIRSGSITGRRISPVQPDG